MVFKYVLWNTWNYGCTPVQNCTNRELGHKCSMHLLYPFGGNSDLVQGMYERTAYFKYFELAMYGPVRFVWRSIYPRLYATTSTVLIWIDITNVPPTDLITLAAICILYSWCRTYTQFQMVGTYVLWDTWELWLYAFTETVRIGIEVTNVWCTLSILLVVIRILYNLCTDVQPISNGMYICILGYLGAMALRLYRKCTNRD